MLGSQVNEQLFTSPNAVLNKKLAKKTIKNILQVELRLSFYC